MTHLEGSFFDGHEPTVAPARMDFSGTEAVLTAASVSERFAVSSLKVSPRIGSSDRFISLPNGGQFLCADLAFLDSLPQESPSEGAVAWLERRWLVALTCVAAVVCALLAGYFVGLPAAAKYLAFRIPVKTEAALGTRVLSWLDDHSWLQVTALSDDKQRVIREGFDRLHDDLPLNSYYRLQFRSSKPIGPNAFALPGGTVVITDDLVAMSQTPEEVLSILAHEIAHAELRHTTRTLLQNSVVAAVAAAVTSDAASLTVAVAGLPVVIAETKYSRQFEEEADEYAFGLLKRKGYSPTAFASIMERLQKNRGKESRYRVYTSTHPVTSRRAARARSAASAGK
jgi:Zn-dependent protease with chaperone function